MCIIKDEMATDKMDSCFLQGFLYWNQYNIKIDLIQGFHTFFVDVADFSLICNKQYAAKSHCSMSFVLMVLFY